jgi:two-component system NtrC family sensor kinase
MTGTTILCVDDEGHVLDSLRRVFLDDGYELLTALGGEEGLALVRRRAVELIISDYRMPGMTGAELLSKVHEERPDVIGIMLSGFTRAENVAELIEADVIYTFVAKPWHDDELRLTVKRALEFRRARLEIARLRALLGTAP